MPRREAGGFVALPLPWRLMPRLPDRMQAILGFLLAAATWFFAARLASLPEAAWSLYRDPDWSYLLNGLALATGTPPGQVDHPGVTVHYLSAALLRLWHLAAPAGEPLVDSVLLRPESALAFLGRAYALLAALSLAGFTAWLARKSGVLAALIFSAILVLSPEVPLNLGRVNPEALFLSLTPLFLRTLAARTALPFAAALCLGLLAKVVFLPLAVFAGLWKRKQLLPAAALFTSVLLLLALPLYPAWGLTWQFYKNLLTHTGPYGSGPHGFFSVAEAWLNITGILGRDPSAFLLALFPAASLVLSKRRKKEFDKLDLLSVAAALVAFLLVIRHGLGGTYPGSRYLLPVTILLAWRTAVICSRAKKIPAALALLFLFSFEAVKLKPLLEERSNFARQIEEVELGIRAELAAHPRCWLLVGNGYWTRPVALLAGANYTLGQFGPDLQRLYPRVLFVVQPALSLRNFAVSNWVPRALVEEKRAEGECFVVAGLEAETETLFGKEKGRPLRPHLRLFGASP